MARAILTLAIALVVVVLAFQPQGTSAAAGDRQIETAFVVLGESGLPVARAITTADVCPRITIDGRALPMTLRAAPSTEPLRTTASSAELSKASSFPVRVCDRSLPVGAKRASITGRALPLPKGILRRIVVIGDTGCRLKAKDNAWQSCNDPATYPFARIAARAAAWKPDAVIHVGDYLYRENPCAEGHPGCTGSPWGYGWDAWAADFFKPGKALLKEAPLILVRGNHESCVRAGQGWWRLLDPRPLAPKRDCNDPSNDAIGDFSPTYAVPLGGGAQVVIMDLSHAGSTPFAPGDSRLATYRKTAQALAEFARRGIFTFAAAHYPIFGIAAKEGAESQGFNAGNPALQRAFAAAVPKIMPRKVDTLLAGHIHAWEQVDFGGAQPSQFVAGFSGTQEDVKPLPKRAASRISPAPGASVQDFNAVVGTFGFMTLARRGATTWKVRVYSAEGALLKQCRISGRRSICEG